MLNHMQMVIEWRSRGSRILIVCYTEDGTPYIKGRPKPLGLKNPQKKREEAQPEVEYLFVGV